MLTHRRVVWLSMVLLLAASACVQTVKGREHPALRDRSKAMRKVAVAPFVIAEKLKGNTASEMEPKVGAEILASKFAESFYDRGVDVVPPADVARALELAGIQGRIIPRQVAAIVAERFGADGLLVGELSRLVDREGGAAGATRGATIGFQVDLYEAPGGARLWTGNVDETQRPLSENVLDASRYPGGGSRWLTSKEMLAWAANEMAVEIPIH